MAVERRIINRPVVAQHNGEHCSNRYEMLKNKNRNQYDDQLMRQGFLT